MQFMCEYNTILQDGRHPWTLESQWLLAPVPCRYQRENVFMFQTYHSLGNDLPIHVLCWLPCFLYLVFLAYAGRCKSEGPAMGLKALAHLLEPILGYTVPSIPRAHTHTLQNAPYAGPKGLLRWDRQLIWQDKIFQQPIQVTRVQHLRKCKLLKGLGRSFQLFFYCVVQGNRALQ